MTKNDSKMAQNGRPLCLNLHTQYKFYFTDTPNKDDSKDSDKNEEDAKNDEEKENESENDQQNAKKRECQFHGNYVKSTF